MALLAGSIAYPPWRSLSSPWGQYTQTWRAFALPYPIAALMTSAGTGDIASAGDSDPISVGIAITEASGVRMIPAAGLYRWREMTGSWGDYPMPWRALVRSGVLALSVSAGAAEANLAYSSGAAATFLMGSACGGNLSAGSDGASQLALLAECGGGDVYRLSHLPRASLSRGRMTWRS